VEAQPKGEYRRRVYITKFSMPCYIEHSVGNTVRKILHHIREEYHTATKGTASGNTRNAFSISKFVLQGQPRKQHILNKTEEKGTIKENDPDDPDSFARGLKPVLMEAIQDVLDELETVYDSVSKNARDHIHSEWVILPKLFVRVLNVSLK
jgi:translation initiation factor eIF-2B subunit beta